MMEIRSYRRVFDLERRVYSVDRLRLNPSGVPVRGVVYFLAAVVVVLAGSSAPLLGRLLDLAPWYMRDLLFPALSASLMALVRVEGRTFHHAAHSLLRFACARQRWIGGSRACGPRRWHPHDVLALPDGSEPRFRRLRYRGPGAVIVGVPHERRGRSPRHPRDWAGPLRSDLILRRRGAPGAFPGRQVVLLAPRARLRVHGERHRGA